MDYIEERKRLGTYLKSRLVQMIMNQKKDLDETKTSLRAAENDMAALKKDLNDALVENDLLKQLIIRIEQTVKTVGEIKHPGMWNYIDNPNHYVVEEETAGMQVQIDPALQKLYEEEMTILKIIFKLCRPNLRENRNGESYY